MERAFNRMLPLCRPDLKKGGTCDAPYESQQEDVERVDTPRNIGATRLQEADGAPWARVRSVSPVMPPRLQASTESLLSIPVTPRGSMPMKEKPFQEEVEADSSTAWMRVRTPSPELTYSRMSHATTPSASVMFVPMMLVSPKHGDQQQQQQPQQQHQSHQAGQVIWMVPVPYPGVNPFLNVAPPNGTGMQDHVPEVGTQQGTPPAGQAINDKQGIPVDPHANADEKSDAETEVMLPRSSLPGDVNTNTTKSNQLTVPDTVLQADTIGKPDQENEETASDYPISLGSVGHPTSCAEPCKYIKKRRGCKDGDKCANCHHCVWQSCVWRSHRRSRLRAEHQHVMTGFPCP